MKTLTELNGKWWYRAIKVIYIMFVALAYIIAVAGTIGAYITIKENKERYVNTVNENAERMALIEELQSRGSTAIQISGVLKEKYHKYEFLKLTREELRAIYGEEQYQKLGEDKEGPLRPETPGTMKWLFLIIPGSIFIAWLISQLIKWIFYYIVLGTIKPSKNHGSH